MPGLALPSRPLLGESRRPAYGWHLLAGRSLPRLILLLRQEAKLLSGLIFLTASLHAAHLVAGITFTPIYVFISRSSLSFKKKKGMLIWEPSEE